MGKFENKTLNQIDGTIEKIDVKIAMMSEIPLGWDKNAAKTSFNLILIGKNCVRNLIY